MSPGTGAANEAPDAFEAPDGARLHRYDWLPDEPPRGQVLLAHGYADHAGRQRSLAAALNARGFAVRALDQRGHGRSPGPRGQVRDGEDWVDALASFLEALQAERGPVALIGHSFGGAAAARLAQRRPDLLDALVLIAPFVISGLGYPGWFLRLAAAASRLAPALPTVRIDAEAVSRLPDEVARYREDPLVYRGGVPLAASRELHAIGERVLRDAEDLVTPLLILHGSEDRLSAPAGSRALHEAVAAPDRTLREIDGGYHDLLHDVEAERVRDGLVAWLEERLA